MPKILSNVKEKILKEGKELLQANGYNNLNIREVAKNSDIAVGTFYNYFSNKDELVREIILNHWNQLLVTIDELSDSENSIKTKLISLSQYIDEFFKTYSGVFTAMMESTATYCPRHKILPQLNTIVEKIITMAIEKGEINPPLSVTKLSKILVPSMFFITKVEDLKFEDFYSILNLGNVEKNN